MTAVEPLEETYASKLVAQPLYNNLDNYSDVALENDDDDSGDDGATNEENECFSAQLQNLETVSAPLREHDPALSHTLFKTRVSQNKQEEAKNASRSSRPSSCCSFSLSGLITASGIVAQNANVRLSLSVTCLVALSLC